MKHGELSQLDPAQGADRRSQLRKEIADASRRVLDIIWRGRDDELLALLC